MATPAPSPGDNTMDRPLIGPDKPEPLTRLQGRATMQVFSVLVLASQAVLLVLFKVVCAVDADLQDVQLYNLYVGIALMMLVGFGYLMTFLRWYGLGAAGLTLFVTCYGVELALLAEPLFEDFWATKVRIDYSKLIDANFAVASILISFGGLIGKVNPPQLWCLVTLEAVAYSAHKRLVLSKFLNIEDVGGTIIIHMFGAYFGLAAAYVLGKPRDARREKASVTSDVLSIVGTAFLWLYWPSFVSGSIKPGTTDAQRSIINTVLALLGATVTTFGLSPLFTDGFRLSPVHAQNSTLAGGVAIGAVANLPLGPFGAAAVGSLAGAVSVFGYSCIQPWLERTLGLHDTCGIHNLHGMPSLVGGIASAVVPAWIASAGAPKRQLAGVALTLVSALGGGAVTGGVMTALFKEDGDVPMADDRPYWEVADDFETVF